MTSRSKEQYFDELVREVGACTMCARMCGSKRVLNRGCGPLNARVLIVGEAPGRLGADASQLPFHGDKSGHNFEALLEFSGLKRSDVFITNAVLCNPKSEDGNNSTPTEREIVNCASNLQKQISLLNPMIVVTLGAVALRATSYIEQHNLTLRSAVRTSVRWNGRELIPFYHPGQRAMIHRSFANQTADYQFLGERARRGQTPHRRVGGKSKPDIAEVAALILETATSGRSYFSLHKLAYLAEYNYFKKYGERMTEAYFVRQKDGPYCVDLHPERLKRAGVNVTVDRSLIIRTRPSAQASLFEEVAQKELPQSSLSTEQMRVVSAVLDRYGDATDDRLKTVSYLTLPMRSILKQERQGTNRFNAPLLF